MGGMVNFALIVEENNKDEFEISKANYPKDKELDFYNLTPVVRNG